MSIYRLSMSFSLTNSIYFLYLTSRLSFSCSLNGSNTLISLNVELYGEALPSVTDSSSLLILTKKISFSFRLRKTKLGYFGEPSSSCLQLMTLLRPLSLISYTREASTPVKVLIFARRSSTIVFRCSLILNLYS